MADVAADSNNATQIKITVDPGKSDDESQKNGVVDGEGDENHSEVIQSQSDEAAKATNDKNACVETSGSARLFLRPSALSRDGVKPSPPVVNSSPVTIFNTSNKFSAVDEPVELLFNLSSSSSSVDKTEQPKTLTSTTATPTATATTTSTIRPAAVSLTNPDYVFGQNLSSRVVESVSNGTGSLFTSVLNAENKKKEGKDSETDSNEVSSTSLLEDAARCQEQRAAKRKYDEVQVTTGEENEKNVLQGGSWVERGRGTLRLNDVENSGSRIVVRTMGSLRVVLNTKIWPGMELTRVSDKSIRVTAMDSFGVLKIFLIQASAVDATWLFDHMQERLDRCRTSSSASSVPASEKSSETEEAPPSAKQASLENES